MSRPLRTTLVRLTNSLVWRSPARAARKLHGFSLAEHSRMLDMLAAARQTASPARRGLYVRHALDEARHATVFALHSAQIEAARGRPPVGPTRGDTEHLYERLGEVGFLAFVHRGERRGRQQFEGYRDYFTGIGDDKARAMFEAILVDERRHESYSRALLVELAGDERGARRALGRAARWEAWRGWRSAGRFVADRLFTLSMLILLVLVTPLALLVRWRAPVRRGWQ